MRLLITLFLMALSLSVPAKEQLVFVGTYTQRGSEGIYAFKFNDQTGELTKIGLAAKTPNPSFLAVHPNGKFLYAVNELLEFNGQKAGSVSAFAINKEEGTLTLLNSVSSKGGAPCHINLDAKGHWAFVANYVGGSFVSLPIQKDGSLGEVVIFLGRKGKSSNPQRQEASHGHSADVDPSNRFIAMADLGTDELISVAYSEEKGFDPMTLNELKVTAGSGPRHLSFHPSGKAAFLIHELNSTVSSLKFDSRTGVFEPVQALATIPEPVPGNTTAEIFVHPSGKFVYGSNRGHDSLAVFKIDQKNWTMDRVEIVPTGGKVIRSFGISPSGKYLLAANQESDNIVVFKIDSKTGKLALTGTKVAVPMPVCIRF